MKTLIVLVAIMSNMLTAGCVKSAKINLPAEIISNQSYGKDTKQVYDIYLPEGRTADETKVMFLFHGGSWSGGDKRDFAHYIDSLKVYLPDYAFVNVNYRLANFTENKFPTQEMDVKSAVQEVLKKSSAYHISKEIILLGASSGAHLALLQAYKYAEDIPVKAVISFFGPTDIRDMYNDPANPQIPYWLNILLGGTPAQNGKIYDESSPLNYVHAGSAPTLIFQGGKDPLVSPSQAYLLQKKLEQAGVANQLVVYPAEGHGWIGSTLHDSFEKIAKFLNEIAG